MRRFTESFRYQSYNEGDFYTPVPIARKLVAPGETISSAIIEARLISAVFERVVTTPVLAQVWMFYVPHRLVWSSWMDYIALDDSNPQIPTGVSWPFVFDSDTAAANALFRRSYKLAYNQFFGDERVGSAGFAWYDDIALDSNVITNRLLAWDQFTSDQIPSGYTQSSFTAAVSGANATIPLDDFARAFRDNQARRRQKVTGDKYVDTLRLMGVELDWRVQMAPEFLGSSQQVIHLRERGGATETSLATRVSEFSNKLSFVLKRRVSFAEHGYILAMVGLRPAVTVGSRGPAEGNLVDKQFAFRLDSDSIADVTGTSLRPRFAHYIRGRNLVGRSENSAMFPSASGTTLYVDPATYVTAAGSGTRHYAFTADVAFKGLTPVAPSKA